MPQNHKKQQNEQPPPSYDGLNTSGMVKSLARSELVQLLLVTSFGCLSLMYTSNLFCWYYIIIIFDYRKNRKEELAEISSIMHTNECSLRNVNLGTVDMQYVHYGVFLFHHVTNKTIIHELVKNQTIARYRKLL